MFPAPRIPIFMWMSSLERRELEAAVDLEDGAGDEARCDEKDDGVRDVLRGAHASRRKSVGDALEDGLLLIVGHAFPVRGGKRAGRDRVDARRSELERERRNDR